MAEMNTTEACLVALTQLMTQLQRGTGWRSQIEKEIKYIHTFDGARGTLPGFISSVERVLADHEDQQDHVWQIIFNNKIQGAARNVLVAHPHENWEQSKQNLINHFRSSKNQLQLTTEISQIQVRNIKDLDTYVTKLVEDITEFAAFDINGAVMTEIFSGMLVQRIKEISSGTLAYTIMNICNLSDIRKILRNFISQDEGNIKINKAYQHPHNNVNFRHNYNPNNYGSYPNNFSQNNRNNTFHYNNISRYQPRNDNPVHRQIQSYNSNQAQNNNQNQNFNQNQNNNSQNQQHSQGTNPVRKNFQNQNYNGSQQTQRNFPP